MPETKASREIKELTLLFEISTKLSETLDLQTVLQPILQMTTEYLGILRSTLTILNRKKGKIVTEGLTACDRKNRRLSQKFLKSLSLDATGSRINSIKATSPLSAYP
jgi:hypothetical protein